MEFMQFLQDTPAAVICLALVAWWVLALVPAYQEGFLRGYRAARDGVAS